MLIHFVTLQSVLVHGCYQGSRLVASLFALELGANPFEVGVLAGLYALFSLMLAVYAGRLTDRIGPRTPMIGGALLTSVSLLVAWAFPGMAAMYVSASLIGLAFIFFNVAVQNMAGLIGTADNRARNFSVLSQGYSLSSALAPFAAGWSVQSVGHVPTFLGMAVIALVPALALWLAGPLAALRTPRPKDAPPPRVMDLLGDRLLRRSFISSGMVVTGWDLYTFYFPVYGHQIGLDAGTIGSVLAVFGVAAFAVRMALPRLLRRYGDVGLLVRALAIGATVFCIFPLFEHVAVLAVLSACMGLSLGLGQPLSLMITYSRSPPGRAGESNGLRLMVNHVTHFAVPVLSGALGTALGVAPVFWFNAVFLVGAARLIRMR